MRRILAIAGTVAILAAACASSGSTRTVRVDFHQDEFASHYWHFFPKRVYAHPGDTVVFDQQWTGEPHTVTLGSIVDRVIPRTEALEKKYKDFDFAKATPEQQQKVSGEFDRVTKDLPTFDPYKDLAAQNIEQPCYLDRAKPPRAADRTCPKRAQPQFNGRQTFYSSGFIPPSGPTGNTYRVPLSKDIAPGTYRFYCVIHFPFMSGELVVRRGASKLPSAATMNAQALKEINEFAVPLRHGLDSARAGRARGAGGEVLPLPLGGYHSADEFTAEADEFLPDRITTRIGQPVTWTITGAHTVSFGVPRYIPIYFVVKDGTVRRNLKVDRPAGGSPKIPPVDFMRGPYRIDGGTYNGSGFYSSGLLGSEPYSTYTLRFSKPGRYRFACLVHPRMVGTLIVRR